jgi:Cu(I)/Ag(I) efflux system membrane fusion protein
MLRNKLAFAMVGLIGMSLAVGGGAGYWFGHQRDKTQSDAPQKIAKVLYWYDPMKPEQHFDKPGKSPLWTCSWFLNMPMKVMQELLKVQ